MDIRYSRRGFLRVQVEHGGVGYVHEHAVSEASPEIG